MHNKSILGENNTCHLFHLVLQLFSAYHKCNTLFHWLKRHHVEVAILRYMHERALSRYMDRSIPRYSARYGDDRKVLRKMMINHISSALSPCVKETRTYSRFTVKSYLFGPICLDKQCLPKSDCSR